MISMNSLIYTTLCATVDSLIRIVNVLTASQTIVQMLKCVIKPWKSGHWKNADFNKMRGNRVWRKFQKRGFPCKRGDFTALIKVGASRKSMALNKSWGARILLSKEPVPGIETTYKLSYTLCVLLCHYYDHSGFILLSTSIAHLFSLI